MNFIFKARHWLRSLLIVSLAVVGCSGGGGKEPLVPATPKGLAATPADGAVALRWTAGTESDLAGYNVYWGMEAQKISSTVFVAAPAVEVNLQKLTNDVQYFFAIDAQDKDGYRSPISQQVSATPQAGLGFQPPQGFLPIPGDGQVTAIWTSMTRTDLKGVHVLWGESSGALDQDVFAAKENNEAVVAPLQNGKTYFFAVEGEDDQGARSLRSAVIAAVPHLPDLVPPTIVKTDPVDQATGVVAEPLVGITFSKTMDPSTLSLTLTPQVPIRVPSWSADQKEAVFGFLGPLVPGQTYNVAIQAKDTAGNVLGGASAFQFTVDDTPAVPSVMGTTPASGALDLPTNGRLSFAFSEPMDKASVQRDWSSNPSFNCAFTWDTANRVVLCQPSTASGAGLAANTSYTVTIKSSAMSAMGKLLAADVALVFKTASGPDTTPPTIVGFTPANGTIGQAPDVEIAITFSEPMDRAWTEAAFVDGVPDYSGTFSWNDRGTILHYRHYYGYSSGTSVIWKLLGQAKDLAGNSIGADTNGSFKVIRNQDTACYSVATLDGFVTDQGEGDINYSLLLVGYTTSEDGTTPVLNRGFLSFDLSCLPAEATHINYAALKVWYFGFGGA